MIHFPVLFSESLCHFWSLKSLKCALFSCFCRLRFLVFAGRRCLKGRRRVVPQAPLPPGSTERLMSTETGLEVSMCIELLSESWFCTYWPYYNIHSFKANAKQQSPQQSGFYLRQGSSLSALAGFAVVSFHMSTITFNSLFSCIFFILTEDKRRWPKGREK